MRRGLGFHNRRSPGTVFSPLSLFTGGVNGAWYDPSDSTTLFSDRAGTTPCGAPGGGSVVPVGLMLDKSQGLTLGSELVTNGGPGFTTTTGWGTFNATVTASGGKLVCTVTGAAPSVYWSLTTVIGTWYKVNIVWENVNATGPSILVNSTGGLSITTTNTDATIYFCAVATTTFVQMQLGNTGGTSTRIISLSTKTISGNHAIAANDTTARPELSARVNLLTYSEDFSNAVWGTGAGGGASISKGTTTGVRPDGTTGTVHTLTFSAVSAGQFAIAFQAAAQAFLNVQLTSSLYVRVASGTATIYLNLEDSGTAPSGTNFVAGSAQTVTTSWQRISLTGTRATAPNAVSVVIGFDIRAAAGQTNAAPVTIEVWGADLRPANIGTTIPAYQRVADQYTYDTVGFPRYLAFNGTSSAMSTPANVNLSGTDKATVFAGVRKLSDGASGNNAVLLETNIALIPNRYAIFAPANAASADRSYWFLAGGSAENYAAWNLALYPAPISNVLSCSMSTVSTLGVGAVVPRINGAQVTPSIATTNTSTGNFPSSVLNIGARGNGSSLFLNGNIYSLIVVGSAVSAGNITATETWVNGKTGGVY